jgi:hypothetical protein
MNDGVAASWAWGLSLTGFTIALHALGIALLTLALHRLGERVTASKRILRHSYLLAASVLGAVGAVLAVLHGLEAAIWAFAYVQLGAMHSLHEAMFYSVDSMSTRGASGLHLDPRFHMIGALEAGAGMLLFGISTAFAFAVIARILHFHREGE